MSQARRSSSSSGVHEVRTVISPAPQDVPPTEKPLRISAKPPSTPRPAERSISEFYLRILDYFFQLVGLAAAIIFGVWAVKAYDVALQANSLALQANSLATTGLDLAAQGNRQSTVATLMDLYTFCVQINSVRLRDT